MADVTSPLARIEAHLRRLGRSAPTRWAPPATPEELGAAEERLGLRLTRELRDLYRWHNGTLSERGDLLESLYMFPGFYLLSLGEAIDTYEHERINDEWLSEWFPLFANGGGDYYLVPCHVVEQATSPVIGWIHSEPDKIVEYESVESMLLTLAECFDEGAFFVNDEDMLDIDDELHRRIAHRLNPTIDEWLP